MPFGCEHLKASLDRPGEGAVRTLVGHSDSVLAVTMIAPDGKTAISASRDNTLKIWDTETGPGTENSHGS